MRRLSTKEWIATALAVIFVAYTLFGGDIISLFQRNLMNENSLAAAGSNPLSGGDEVIINDIVAGEGAEAAPGREITAHYILSLSDGTVVQNSKDVGIPFKFVMGAGKVIPGWEQGLAGMKVGGVRTIIVPPELAYGASQVGPIPPNSTLIFTVELLDVKEAAPQAQ
jgi:FKBP-type peptidyl-prolyl cis-trans isomerase